MVAASVPDTRTMPLWDDWPAAPLDRQRVRDLLYRDDVQAVYVTRGGLWNDELDGAGVKTAGGVHLLAWDAEAGAWTRTDYVRDAADLADLDGADALMRVDDAGDVDAATGEPDLADQYVTELKGDGARRAEKAVRWCIANAKGLHPDGLQLDGAESNMALPDTLTYYEEASHEAVDLRLTYKYVDPTVWITAELTVKARWLRHTVPTLAWDEVVAAVADELTLGAPEEHGARGEQVDLGTASGRPFQSAAELPTGRGPITSDDV